MRFPLRALRLAQLRPAEKVAAAFLGFLAFELARAPTLSTDHRSARSSILVGALMGLVLAGAARLHAAYRARPWPDAVTPQAQRLHSLLGRVCLLFAGLGVYALATLDWSGFAGGPGDHLATMSSIAFGLLGWLMLICMPGALVWLGLGLHLKRHARLVPGRLAREALGELARQVRDWAPPLVLIAAYRWMGLVLNANDGSIRDCDAVLARIDRVLCFGHDPVVVLQHLGGLRATEWATFCYGAYFILYAICLGAVFALERPEPFREIALALTLALACGYLGYTLVPAQGPAYASHLFPAIHDRYFDAMREALVDPLKIRRDCMPSLHTCTSLLLFWSCWRHRRKLAWVVLPIVATIPVACIYLGFHYLIDVLAGAALAGAVVVVAPRWAAGEVRSEERSSADPGVLPAS